MRPATGPRTAFVLSGGGSLGAIQVGMLHALYERGIAPDLLVGTSAGALNAGFVASRPQTPATAIELAGIWRMLRREDIFPVSMASLVRGLCQGRDHVVPHRGLRQLIARHVQFDDLGGAAIPLHLVAFDLDEGCEVLLSDGPAIDAITAAAAIPGVFPAVQREGRRLVDGGVVNNTPISHAVKLGAERVYVLPTRDPGRPPGVAPATARGLAMHAFGVLMDSRLTADIARYSRDVELIVLPAANTTRIPPTAFHHANRLLEEARTAARQVLDAQAGDAHLRLVA